MSISFKGKADEKELVSLVQDMVRINSINPFAGELSEECPGEAGMIEYLARFFEKEGIPYTLQQVLPGGRDNLVAVLKGKGEGALAFEAHIDTVTVDGMTIEPFDPVIKDGKIYGRGSCDDKGSVDENGVYTAPSTAKSGDMVAVRASLKSDPSVFAVSIIYIS